MGNSDLDSRACFTYVRHSFTYPPRPVIRSRTQAFSIILPAHGLRRIMIGDGKRSLKKTWQFSASFFGRYASDWVRIGLYCGFRFAVRNIAKQRVSLGVMRATRGMPDRTENSGQTRKPCAYTPTAELSRDVRVLGTLDPQ